jgi:hypothetical protein
MVRRQSSQTSSAASERILALGPHKRPTEIVPLAPVDLDDAEDHEHKITAALGAIKDQLAELMKTCPLGEQLLPSDGDTGYQTTRCLCFPYSS